MITEILYVFPSFFLLYDETKKKHKRDYTSQEMLRAFLLSSKQIL